MKITAVRAHTLSAPLEEALWTAQEALKDSSLILVEVETDEGLTGYGEIKGSPMKAIAEWVARFGEVIKGADPLAHEIIWNRLFNLTVPRPRAMFGGDGAVPADRAQRAPAGDGRDRRHRHRAVGPERQGRGHAGVQAARRRAAADLHLLDRRLLPARRDDRERGRGDGVVRRRRAIAR